jgi:hypothetical protein
MNQNSENVKSKMFEDRESFHSTPKTLLDHARKYLSMGLSLIPIQREKKVPALETWMEYQRRLPTDRELIEWFSSGNQNIATVSGQVSHEFILEIDDSPQALPELTKHFPWLHTPTLMAQSKRGIHYHIKCDFIPAHVTHLTRKCGSGTIELRANRTYTLLPPSKHPSGIYYKWINPETPRVEANKRQFDDLVSYFTTPGEGHEEDDSREAFNSQDIPPIEAASAEEALKEAIRIAEPDRSRNIVGFLLACKLRNLGLTMAEAFPFMILYWKAMDKIYSVRYEEWKASTAKWEKWRTDPADCNYEERKPKPTRYEKWEAKSSLRSAYRDRDAEFENANVGFVHMVRQLYVQIGQPEHKCREFHDKSNFLVHLQKAIGQGRHGRGNRLDCPGCVHELGRSVTMDMGFNFKADFWIMTLPLRNKEDEKAYKAIEKRAARKEGGDGGGIGLASFANKRIYVACNYQVDSRMKQVSWQNDAEKIKKFIIGGLSVEPKAGSGRHKIRPFGSFIHRDYKKKEGNKGFHRLSVPAPNDDIKRSLKLMHSTVEDTSDGFNTKLSPVAVGFFKGIILGDWSGVHRELPLPENDALWKSIVHEKKPKTKPGKIAPRYKFGFDDPEKIAKDRIEACRAHIEDELRQQKERQRQADEAWEWVS